MFEKKSYPAAGGTTDQIRGKLNGREFTSIADADSRLGSKLEVFAAGDYMWISFRDIAGIEIEPPKRLRDLLWAPAKLQTGPAFRSRDLGEVLLPAMSPLCRSIRTRLCGWAGQPNGARTRVAKSLRSARKCSWWTGRSFRFLKCGNLKSMPKMPCQLREE